MSLAGKNQDVAEIRICKEDSLGGLTKLLSRKITMSGTLAQGRADSVPINTTDQLVEGDKIFVQIRNISGSQDFTTLADSNCIIGAK